MDNVCGKGSGPGFSDQLISVKVERNVKNEEEDQSLKNLKVSYQSIKHMFPKCRVKLTSVLTVPVHDNQKTDEEESDECTVGEDKPKSEGLIVKLEREVPKENGHDCFKKEIPKPEVSRTPRLSDIFIDVEWITEGKVAEVVENDPNTKVQEILVFRPDWIPNDCKKVIFTDLQVNLFNFEEEEKRVKAYLEKRRKQKQRVETTTENLRKEKEDIENKLGDQLSESISSSYAKECTTEDEGNNCSPASKTKSKRRKPVDNKTISKPSIRRKHECELCGKSFQLKALLFGHLIVHLGEKPYKCDDCGRRLRTLGKLKKHIRIHTGERPFSCPSCEKRFKQKEHLNSHVRLIHGEQGGDLRTFVRKIKKGSYECTKCKEHFKQLYQLRIHVVMMHTNGGSAYSCKVCGTEFTQSASLTAHVKRGHCKKEGT